MAENTETFKCPECGTKVLDNTKYCVKCEKKVKNEGIINEAVDVKKVIKDLGDTEWGKDNDSQMKAVQLLKGLAFSDDPKSNDFMKQLSDASTSIAKKVVGESAKEETAKKNVNEAIKYL